MKVQILIVLMIVGFAATLMSTSATSMMRRGHLVKQQIVMLSNGPARECTYRILGSKTSVYLNPHEICLPTIAIR